MTLILKYVTSFLPWFLSMVATQKVVYTLPNHNDNRANKLGSTNLHSRKYDHLNFDCSYSYVYQNVKDYVNSSNIFIGYGNSSFGSRFFSDHTNLSSTILSLSSLYYPVAVRNLFITGGCKNNSSFIDYNSTSCSDSRLASYMWTSVMAMRDFSVLCNGMLWTAQNCYGSYRFCSNCSNPCSKYYYTPSSDLDSILVQENFIGFEVNMYYNIWPDWTQSVESNQFNISIFYNLTSAGKITCAPFQEASQIGSYLAIKLSSNSRAERVTNHQLSGKLIIFNLFPSSVYKVYCYTEVEQSSPYSLAISPISAILAKSTIAITKESPLPKIIVSAAFTSLTTNVSSLLTLKPSFLIGANLTVAIQFSFVNHSLCSSTPGEDAIGISNSLAAYFSPPKLSFSSPNLNPASFYIEASALGCYALRFSGYVNGTVSVDFESVFVDLDGSERIGKVIYLNSTDVPQIPLVSIVNCKFSSNALSIDITFSSDTNQGVGSDMAVNFQCSDIVAFPLAYMSTCRFSKPSLLRIFPPTSGYALPLPGDQILLLEGKIKPACLGAVSEEFCEAIDYIPSQNITVSSSAIITVSPSISAPSQVTLGSNITLDISASIGNGGRKWKSISWSVLYANHIGETYTFIKTADTITLENVLNGGSIDWFDCSPNSFDCNTVPGYALNASGVYQFQLNLTNFLGVSSAITTSVSVVSDAKVPLIRILGPEMSSIYCNSSIIIRTYFEAGSAQSCPGNVAIVWVTYRDDSVDAELSALTAAAKDHRSLTIEANSLHPFHLYIFEVTLFCGDAFAQDSVSRYILPNELRPALANWESLTVSLSNPLVFNGSLLQPPDSYAATDIKYEWSCVQVSPLDMNGCDAFYSFADISAVVLSFENPRLVFAADSKYLISVQLKSSNLGLESAYSQTVTTLPLSDPSTAYPALGVGVPYLKVNTTYGYAIDANVSCDDTFVATWSILNTNSTLSTRLFAGGGSINFPAVIPSSMLDPRVSFTFVLSAFAVTSSCQSIHCVDAKTVVSSQFSANVNKAPSNGYFRSRPSSGDEFTEFTLFATNWQDPDLPLSYIFYQSNNLGASYNIIRQRMQLSFMVSSLAPPSTNAGNLSLLRCAVSDYFGAVTVSDSSAEVATKGFNVSHQLTMSRLLEFSVVNLFQPEAVLSEASSFMSAMNRLNCSSSAASPEAWETSSDCNRLMTEILGSLRISSRMYNDGLYLMQGLTNYLQFFSGIYSNALSFDSFGDMQTIFTQIIESMLALRFNKGDIASMLNSVFSSSENIIDIVSSRADDWQVQISSLAPGIHSNISALVSAYFDILPFGLSERFESPRIYNASMAKVYIDPSQVRNREVSVDNFALSAKIFAENETLGVSFLNLASKFLLSSPSNVSAQITAAHFVRLDISVPAATLGRSEASILLELLDFEHAQILLSNAANANAANASDRDPVVIYRNCSDAAASPVICSEAQTGGREFVFSNVSCLAEQPSQVLAFSCPVFSLQVNCLFDGSDFGASFEPMELGNQIKCAFPLAAFDRSAPNSSISSVSIAGTFTASSSVIEVSRPFVYVLPPKPSDSLISMRAGLRLYAILLISIAALVFAFFLWQKLKDLAPSTAENYGGVATSEAQAQFANEEAMVTTIPDDSISLDVGADIESNMLGQSIATVVVEKVRQSGADPIHVLRATPATICSAESAFTSRSTR